MPVGYKVRKCERCNGAFVEGKEAEVSRKNLLAKMLCHSCQDDFKEFKKQERIPPLYYIGRDEPIPEKFRYNPESETALN